jgi:hypothetical protein
VSAISPGKHGRVKRHSSPRNFPTTERYPGRVIEAEAAVTFEIGTENSSELMFKVLGGHAGTFLKQ